MNRREARGHDFRELGVSHARHLDVLGNPLAVLPEAGHGAKGNVVGGADERVDVWHGVEYLLGAEIARVHREGRALLGLWAYGNVHAGTRVEKRAVPLPPGGNVLLVDADVARRSGGLEDGSREVVDGVVVVLVDAGVAVQALTEDDHGNVERVDRPVVRVREDRGNEDDAVDLVPLGKEVEVVDLDLLVVVSVGEKHLVAVLGKNLGDACHHAANGVRVDLGDDDANELGLSRAQRPRLLGGHVARLVDDACDELALLLRDVTVVEVARDGRPRNPGKLGNLVYVHVPLPSLALRPPHAL